MVFVTSKKNNFLMLSVLTVTLTAWILINLPLYIKNCYAVASIPVRIGSKGIFIVDWWLLLFVFQIFVSNKHYLVRLGFILPPLTIEQEIRRRKNVLHYKIIIPLKKRPLDGWKKKIQWKRNVKENMGTFFNYSILSLIFFCTQNFCSNKPSLYF